MRSYPSLLLHSHQSVIDFVWPIRYPSRKKWESNRCEWDMISNFWFRSFFWWMIDLDGCSVHLKEVPSLQAVLLRSITYDFSKFSWRFSWYWFDFHGGKFVNPYLLYEHQRFSSRKEHIHPYHALFAHKKHTIHSISIIQCKIVKLTFMKLRYKPSCLYDSSSFPSWSMMKSMSPWAFSMVINKDHICIDFKNLQNILHDIKICV